MMADWVLAVDPGTFESGVLWYSSEGKIHLPDIMENEKVFECLVFPPPEILRESRAGTLAIEAIACYGEAIGVETLETELLIGRLAQAWLGNTAVRILRHTELATKRIKTLLGANGKKVILVYRKEVCSHLCNTANAKDTNVHQAIVDRYGPSMSKAKGTKKNPGLLFGIRSHLWSTLGVAITAVERADYYLAD